MSGPSIAIDLDKIRENAGVLVEVLARSGMSLTGVTKAALGLPSLAQVMVDAGATAIGDSRIENLERLRAGGIDAPTVLLRSPMPSQVARVVRSADVSCNTEIAVIEALGQAATDAQRRHGVLLMVELGDLREGIRPEDLPAAVEATLTHPALRLVGIGTNLACRSGIVPDETNMAVLSDLADRTEASSGITLDVVSGGNSANLDWLLSGAPTGRINDLRLGEAILLGCEPLHRRPVLGLHTDAVTISAEVIESKRKPTQPTGTVAQTAFGVGDASVDCGEIWQTIVALGHQDTDPDGLVAPPGVTVLGASSDHLVLRTERRVPPGDLVHFQPDYAAMLRAMTSPFVTGRDV